MLTVGKSGKTAGIESLGLVLWENQWEQGEREEYLALKRTAFRGLSD
jgi:hypothetical protein